MLNRVVALFLMSFTTVKLDTSYGINDDYVSVNYHIDNTYRVQVNIYSANDGLLTFYEDEVSRTAGLYTVKVLISKFNSGNSYFYAVKTTDIDGNSEIEINKITVQ